MDMEIEFSYKPLNEEINEIRLFRIQRCDDNRNIYGELTTVSLDDHPPRYRTLSYEWGVDTSNDSSNFVYINSALIHTTLNLRLALKYLRNHTWYWIDFVCIDQKNDIERAIQVRLMTRIYETASNVDIWLGPDESNNSKGIELVNEFVRLENEVRVPQNETLFPFLAIQLWVPEKLRHWDGFCELLAKTYWTRLWIIQEIVVAKRPDAVNVHCGPHSAPFTAFASIIKGVDMMVYRTDSQPGVVQPICGSWYNLSKRFKDASLLPHTIHHHASYWRGGGRGDRVSLLHLLFDYSNQQCTDPRDKIYSLLGVSTSFPTLELDISYSIPVQEVYKNAAQYIICGSNSLDILQYCQPSPPATALPTWVPNWDTYNSRNRIFKHPNQDWKASFNLPPSFHFSIGGSSLFTRAILLGRITSLYSTSKTANINNHSPELYTSLNSSSKELFSWLYFASHTFSELHHYSWDISQTAAVPRTISCFHSMLVRSMWTLSQGTDLLPYETFVKNCKEIYNAGIRNLQLSPALAGKRTLWYITHRPKQLFSLELKPRMREGELKGIWVLEEKGEMAVGLGPLEAREGDVVTVVAGCKHPVLLRGKRGRWEVVGEVYVDGFMSGEAVGRFDVVDVKLV